jgi:sialate O-acetylesterase
MKACVLILVCMTLANFMASRAAKGDVRLAGVFGEGMVLQREANAPLWGWAQPGEKVTVSLGAASASAVADANGRWKAALPPMKAGGPFPLTVAGDKDTLTVRDVLVGEVWLCSGQSNMGTLLREEPNSAEEIKSADYPQIRLLRMPGVASPRPLDDAKVRWTPCSPQMAGGFPGAAYFFARKLHKDLGVPIGLLHAAVGDSSILTWMNPQAIFAEPALKFHADATRKLQEDYTRLAAEEAGKGPGRISNAFRSQGGFLYCGMISPLVGYGMRGAIWYQGEKDGGRPGEYPLLFKTMVGDWRRTWGQGDWPFLFVQISTYKGWGDVQAAPDPLPGEGTWGFIREAQTRCLAVANTAMAVSLDRQDFESAHPFNKKAVGERLALAALAKAYGKQIVYSGPMYESMRVEGDGNAGGSGSASARKVRLRFSQVGGGLVVEGAKGTNGFAIAGKDRKFVWAEVAVDRDSLLAWSQDVPEPAAVRYAWANFPYFGLANREGLPAPTFRTDDWPAPAVK